MYLQLTHVCEAECPEGQFETDGLNGVGRARMVMGGHTVRIYFDHMEYERMISEAISMLRRNCYCIYVFFEDVSYAFFVQRSLPSDSTKLQARAAVLHKVQWAQVAIAVCAMRIAAWRNTAAVPTEFPSQKGFDWGNSHCGPKSQHATWWELSELMNMTLPSPQRCNVSPCFFAPHDFHAQ